MSNITSPLPAVLVISGLDPSGGAGIQADIEAIGSMGCHSLPIISALTVQDTQRVHRFEGVDPLLLLEQARTILEDIPVGAIKIGMLGTRATIEAVHSLLQDYPAPPVVLDPILSAGGGGELLEDEARDALCELLIPQTTILVPNSQEARLLAREADNLDACAEELLDFGCDYVLITGTHEPGPAVDNTLYGNHRRLETFSWDRLPHEYHGSGCTLASTIAALLAHGLEPFTAVHEAQEYTWSSLQHGFRPGKGQHIPKRLFWAHGEQD